MLHPVGPLPASVYWRRRIAAAAGGLLALVLLLTLFTIGGGDGGGTRTTATGATGSTTPTPTPTATPTATGSGTPTETGRAGAGSGGGGGAASGPGTVATSAPTATIPVEDRTASRSGPRPTNTSTAVVPCSDVALRVTVEPAADDYEVGRTPVLRLIVRNVTDEPCRRNLAAAQQEVFLFDGAGTRLWSSNDCYPGASTDLWTLEPGERVTFSVTWSGLSSKPKCAGVRTRVEAGEYQLLGRVGTLYSKRIPITLHNPKS